MKHILVIRGGAIGDFILTLPVFSALRQNFPTARIEILGYPRIATLALPEMADAVLPIESPALAGFFTTGTNLDSGWYSYFAKFDLIISYAYDPEQIFGNNIQRSSKARFIVAPHRPKEDEAFHASEVFLQPLEQLGIFKSDSTPRLARLSTKQSTHTTPFIAIHPGSGSEKKNWPEEKWIELLRHLSDQNYRLLLIGGEAEGEKLNRIATRLPMDKLEVLQNLPLTELTQKLSHASFFLGHDSGITHLAAALDLPGLVLWGSSNLDIWHPRSEKMKILHAGTELKRLPVETVMREIESWRKAV